MLKGRERRLYIQRPLKIATVPRRHKTLSSRGTLENQAYLKHIGRLKIKTLSNRNLMNLEQETISTVVGPDLIDKGTIFCA